MTMLTTNLDAVTQRLSAALQRLITVTEHQADQVVAEVATAVLADIVDGWPVDSGVSRAAWWGPRKVGPAQYQLGNPTLYAATIEYGGYPGIGPKTEAGGGENLGHDIVTNRGIYPKQKPAAPVRRALAKHAGEISEKLAAVQQHSFGR